jgi:8-hydroxy-5-deazaflavin:NADPH oxidoreductase
MSTAIIGTGSIGSNVARDLVAGGEPVIVAGADANNAQALAQDLGRLARASSTENAISEANAIVLAVWLDVMKDIIRKNAAALAGKVVIDPSNPIAPDGKGGFRRTLPDGQSAGSIVASLLPPSAHYVKAFGTVAADKQGSASRRTPERAVLFYATDDVVATKEIERLIDAAGFSPIRAGGVADALRIEVFGDLHDYGGLKGQLLSADQARGMLQR